MVRTALPFVVEAKIRRPALRGDQWPRQALIARLREDVGPVVAVQAGAGFGKTTTVRQWIEEDPRPSAWLTLDSGDNDPVVMLRHLVSALSCLRPMPDVEALLAKEPPAVEGSVLPELARALATGRPPAIMVFDDVHALSSTASGDLLTWLASVLPEGWTLALAGRSMPPMHLARLLVNQTATVLRHGDLAFSRDECLAFVDRSLAGTSQQEALALYDATEGWPAGIYLSLLALKAAPERAAVLAGLAATTRSLSEYFNEEFLQGISPEVRSFLLRTSMLQRLSGPLCDAVLDRDGSGVLLRQLAESDNLFVVALEDAADAYRYHHLFADLLLTELRRVAPAEEAPLRRRAAAWLSANEDADAAFQQALLADDRELAIAIAHHHLDKHILSGQVETLARWRASFTDEEAREDPWLALLSGWVCFVNGHGDEVERWIEVAGSLDQKRHLSNGLGGDLGLALATLAMLHGRAGVKTTGLHARTVLGAGRLASAWWPIAVLLDAQTSYLADRDADVLGLCRSAEFETRGTPSAHAVALAHLACAHFNLGDEQRGQRAVSAALAELKDHHLEDFTLVSFVHAVHALAAARRKAFDESESAQDTSLHLLDLIGAVPRTQCHARICLARAALARGDVTCAERLTREASGFLEEEPDAVVLWDGVDSLRREVEDRRRRDRGAERLGLSEAELRVLAELPTHRSLQEIGDVLYVSRNTIKTHAVAIYRKLGVSGRSAAVQRAQSLGLFDDEAAT